MKQQRIETNDMQERWRSKVNDKIEETLNQGEGGRVKLKIRLHKFSGAKKRRTPLLQMTYLICAIYTH